MRRSILIALIAGALLHAWTIILSWQLSGFGAAMRDLLLPGPAEIVWAFVLYRQAGFWNLYTLSVIAVAVLQMVAYLGGRRRGEERSDAET